MPAKKRSRTATCMVRGVTITEFSVQKSGRAVAPCIVHRSSTRTGEVMKIKGKLAAAVLGLVVSGLSVSPVSAQGTVETLFQTLGSPSSPVVRGGGNCPAGATVIYDTTHASNQGAEITAAANGAATCMGDKIVTIDHTLPVCEISVDVFTLASTAPFDLTLEIYTDCSTNGVGGSACGTGTGTLIPSSTTTVTGITPGVLGEIFTVAFPVNNASLSTETDNTITVKLNASRSDVFWRINETPAIGALPAGEPGTSVVERCGSTAANNGCQRNFGVNNNFAMTIRGAPAATPPVFAYTPAAGAAVNFTGGTSIGSIGTGSIAVAIGTPGVGTGAAATTTTTCTAPTAPFAGFGQSVTAEGAAATTTGGPLSGTCTLGAAQVVQTLTCTEMQGSTPVARTFELTCPAGTAVPLTSTPISGSTVTLPTQTVGTAATTAPISFQNPGLVAVDVTCVAPAAPFSAAPLVISVPAGGSAATTVTFNSATAGTFGGTLNCSAGSQQFVFTLAGTASAPSVPVPAFGDGSRILLVLSALLMGMFTLGLRARRG